MAQEEFKTGIDAKVTLDLDIPGETVSALIQITVVFYYIVGATKTKFSWWAKDITETEIAAEAIAENVILREIVFNGEQLVMVIPIEDTDKITIDVCDKASIFAEIAYLDSNGDKQKFLDVDKCDVFISTAVKSITTGWL